MRASVQIGVFLIHINNDGSGKKIVNCLGLMWMAVKKLRVRKILVNW